MRYTCPSCQRVFYLETKTVSPCPACGTTLSAEGEDDAGAAAAPQEASQQADDQTSELAAGGSWLLADSDVPAPPAAAPEPPAPPPQQAPPQPTATAMLSQVPLRPPPAGPGAPGLAPPGPPVSDELETIGVSTGITQGVAPATDAAMRPAQARPPTLTRMPTGRAPSGSRLFVITGVTVLLLAGIAFSLLAYFRPRWVVTPTAPRIREKQLEEEIDKLTGERDKLADELTKAKAKSVDADKAYGSIKLERDRLEEQAGALEGRLGDRAKAARLTLEAARLLERRSDLAKALTKTDEALKADPNFLLAQRVRGQILAASGLAKQALVTLTRTDEAARKAGGAGDAQALALAGEVCLTDLADRHRALVFYKRAAASGKKTAFGLIAEARALQLGDELTAAATKAAEARRASPSLALAPLVMGETAYVRALVEAGDRRKSLLEEADKHLAGATRLDPGSARANLMRGKVLLEKAKLVKALFGIARLKPLSDAERCLETARRLKPRLAGAHEALAELRLAESLLRDPAVAHSRAKVAVELTGGQSAPALALLARAQAATGDPAAAVTTIDKAIKIDPGNRRYPEAKRRYQRDAKGLPR
ncbi:MAG: tetratricopeptide repeat protein [Planctomycetota bacterium]